MEEGYALSAADACLGVEGLPQSATGGTSLFTGLNAPAHIGTHAQGYPNSDLKKLIAREGLLRKARERGIHADFANAYTPRYFERGRSRHRSVTTVTAETAGFRLKNLEDLQRGKAVYRDFSNQILREAGHALEFLSPEQAGERLGHLARRRDLLVYEYFQTDIVGHRGTIEEAQDLVDALNRFLEAAIGALDPGEDAFVLSSDHGNIEYMNTSSHTLNPVPILLWGNRLNSLRLSGKEPTICDVTPGIISFF